MDSLSAVFQPAFSQSGFSQQLFDFNAPPPHDIDVGQEALEAFPDSANRMTVQNSMSSTHIDWNSTTSFSTSRSDCDSSRTTSEVSKPLGNETFGQESQQEHKSLISALRSFPCPHCLRFFKSEELLGSHEQISHRHQCNDCGQRFTLFKDLKRHQQTLSCQEGLAARRSFACKCGKTYVRNDHLLRHISKATRGKGDDKRHAV